MAVRDFQNVVYTDDQGNEYQYKVAADVFAQVGGDAAPKIGGRDLTSADGSLPPMPRNLRPRMAVVSNAINGVRRVVCLTKTASLYLGTEPDVDLPVYNSGAPATFSFYNSVGEKKVKKNPAH